MGERTSTTSPEAIIIALSRKQTRPRSTNEPSKRPKQKHTPKKPDYLFFETSAKSGDNVKELFSAIAKKLPLDKGNARGAGRIGAGSGGVDLRGNTKTPAQACSC